ncbi:site-specific integrase [Microbulbifer pacificus]|uniref:site-specific integrase n=1 Tax=Microbulbifer pacificus TaxID=407164 RepID=UPI000CF51F99|nr:site-specific integrase [Microbulbifer pacificus]
MLQVIEIPLYERRRKLLVRDGMPLYYPNLWITAEQLQSKVTSQAKYLAHLAMFQDFLDAYSIDLVARLQSRPRSDYLTDEELSQFVADAGLAKSSLTQKYAGARLLRPAHQYVSSKHFEQRVEVVCNYIEFLYDKAGDRDSKHSAIDDVKNRLKRKLNANRPSFKRRKLQDAVGLTDSQRKRIREVMHPEGPDNPFSSDALKLRNYIILELGLTMGLRRSEMLLLKVSDISAWNSRLKVVDLEDPRIDARTSAPQFKTHEREIHMPDELARSIENYMSKYRERKGKASAARKHPFLLVSHGKSEGVALSENGLNEVLARVKTVAPELNDVHPHTLRHDCVYTLLASMKEELDILTPEDRSTKVQKVLTWMFGWSPDSKMPELYGAKFWREEADKAIQRRAKRFSINEADL